MTAPEPVPLPAFVNWPIFPFTGVVAVRDRLPNRDVDPPRDGEPGGSACGACAAPDSSYLWVDDRWRVRAPERASGVPVQVFLESREHLDMDEFDQTRAAEMGQLIVRIERALQAVEGIKRAHVNRWGDGGSHFHLWFYGRPVGETQMLGFCMPLWAMTLPPTPDDVWHRNLATVAAELAKGGGRAIV